MTVIDPAGTAPRRLLLATDLSARCDRALDRAAQLAGEWQAELVALNVLDPAALPDQALAWAGGASDEQLLQVAKRQLGRDLGAANVKAAVRIVRGADAAAAIREAAASVQADLVITGVSRNETLGRFLLGSTVEQLARTLSLPLLVVRSRLRGRYERIVVATDFSDSSRRALLATAGHFPGRELILYHSHALPMARLADPATHQGLSAAIERTECAAFLAATSLPEGVTVRPVVECGTIETTLARYVRQHDVDLVVLGSHGRSGVMSLLLGRTAAKLLDWLSCDMLLVPEPRRQVAPARPAANG